MRVSLFGFFCWITVPSFAQVPVISSTPIEKTRIPILEIHNGPASFGDEGPIANFRLFLKYSSNHPFSINLEGHPVALPAGSNATADLTFEHIPNFPATIHLQRSGDLEPIRIEVPDSIVSNGTAIFTPRSGEEFPMSGAFTLMTRFATTSPKGTLAARTPKVGKWQPNGKTMFLRGGVLHYDIGWVGAIRGGKNLADGKEHTAVLTVDGSGHARLYADGSQVAEKKGFTSKDDPNHVFKIGSTATNFAGDFKDGEIEQVMFWKRALNPDEAKSLGTGNAEKVNTPDFHWKASKQNRAIEKKRALTDFGAVPGYSTGFLFEDAEGVELHEAWIQPLEKSNHGEIIRSWNQDSYERGKTIYNQLCVTCHGTTTQEGSIPLSLKFHEGEFKNGKDPYRIWQTLTNGYGLMTPMPQYSTRQKYDVIHYIRKEFLEKSNPKQLFEIDDAYLAALPRGMTLVEEKDAEKRPPQYKLMDFGNVLFGTYQIEPGPIDQNVNIAQKGIAIRLDPGPGGVSKGKAWAIYDHDTMRLAAFYTGVEFVDWKGIDFDGSHGTHTSIVGERILVNEDKPGWANPETGDWDAPRVVGKDGRKFGPVPRDWVQYRGLHSTPSGPILEYTSGKANVLELVALLPEGLARFVEIAPTKFETSILLGPATIAAASSDSPAFEIEEKKAGDKIFQIGKVGPSAESQAFQILYSIKSGKITVSRGVSNGVRRGLPTTLNSPPPTVTTKIIPGDPSSPFTVDILTVPDADLNPHQSWMRTSGFDFYPDGKRAAVCTWMGDVWLVDGVDQSEGELTWRRICSGLFQPLGLKIVDGSIYVSCRDQIAKLHDKNGDETIDFIECFNNDHQVTEHFHEFAMGLQTDEAGNFYYAKSARHAKDSLVPHHGTLLRVSPDGKKTDILATGFRAANGVCLNPDGTFIVTDQEGHWNPKNRINWVNGDGPREFFGNIFGYSPVTDPSDGAMKKPLCWITNSFDRSPAELLWVPENAAWGNLNGQLLNLSYGYGKIFVVPHEEVNGQKQGGMCELPIDSFPTGVMRGRFHPVNGQLYTCGMFAWAGSQQQAGGFYRVRKTSETAHLPIRLEAKESGMVIGLTEAVDPASVQPENFTVMAWDLKRSANYGSKHFNERELTISAASVDKEGKTVTLTIPKIAPSRGMSIELNLRGKEGEEIHRLIHHSIFELSE